MLVYWRVVGFRVPGWGCLGCVGGDDEILVLSGMMSTKINMIHKGSRNSSPTRILFMQEWVKRAGLE